MHRRFGYFIIAALVGALSACSSDSVSGTQLSAENHVALITATTKGDTVTKGLPSWSSLYFNTTSADTSNDVLGQSLSNYSQLTLLISSNETASLVAAMNGANGAYSDGKVKPVVEFLSDWKAVNPEKHPGVKYTGVSDIVFIITGYQLDEKGEFLRELPVQYITKTMSAPNSTIKLDLPAEKNVVRFAVPRQRFHIGCTGNDSLTFHGEKGLSVAITDVNQARFVGANLKPQDVTVRCDVYKTASAALAALNGAKLH